MSQAQGKTEYLAEHWLDAGCHINGKRPQEVLDALIVPEIVNCWFTRECRSDVRPGGTLFWKWSDSEEETCAVLEYEPGRKLVCEWNSAGGVRTAFTITVDWLEDRQATRLRLREGPFPCTEAGMKAFVDIATGWGHELLAMRLWLEQGMDTRRGRA
ncbi:MAG: SRPBCC domain-containing protein [bacterium]|jgi:uncharacterized protein YndB with AHSA1/START domain